MSFNSPRSAKSSGQRSKRSLSNSVSSNPSGSSNGKRKKSNQKTLGVAWGSNSLSSSRSSFRNSPFSDFGSYMEVKNRKLQDQFDAEASSSSLNASSSGIHIFHGVSIFVDGFTIPSSQELRGYMLKYGGRFENYFSRRRVTHIICSNLADGKMKNMRSFSSGLPVVKPTWISDSAAANKLLSSIKPWIKNMFFSNILKDFLTNSHCEGPSFGTPYQINPLSDSQPRLSAFFAPKNRQALKDTTTHITCEEIQEREDSTLKAETSKDVNSSMGEFIKCIAKVYEKSDIFLHDNSNSTVNEEISGGNIKCEKMEAPNTADAEDKSCAHESSYCGPSASVSSHCLNDTLIKGSPSANVVRPYEQSHSTLGDPNFVENYFKNSRLHFIGTWRNRYQKCFPNSHNEFKFTSSLSNSGKTFIIHVDMDCFFVSVVIRNNPELKDKPVAVCHSDNPKGTAEISSANYPARDYGVKAGIFVRDAKALCPHLVIVPYSFEAYEEVAHKFYETLHKHSNIVQAVSCDEAFLAITDSEGKDPDLLASTLRKEIFETTGCSASAGIAGNMLMARLATKTAKPDGQFYIPPDMVDDYLCQLPIKALPGIGRVLEDKLKERNVWTCGQLRIIPKDTLQKDFGMKTGEMLWNYSRGVDNRLVGMIKESKSIGAEVNWGVRFKDLKDSQHFLLNLCKEVSLRLQGCGVQGRTFTLKMKKRRKHAEEPAKYMGCGDCENLSHSVTVPVATDDVEVLQRITNQLFGFFHVDVKDIRGIGLQVSKLESEDASKQGVERNTLKSWLASSSTTKEEQSNINYIAKERADIDSEGQRTHETEGQMCAVDSVGLPVQTNNNSSISGAIRNQVSDPPPLSDLDRGVIESLPPELFSELNEIYNGKLADLVAKSKGKEPINEHTGLLLSDEVPENNIPAENKYHMAVEAEAVPICGAGSCNLVHPSETEKADLLPSSLSQVDISVLQELPEALRTDILDQLPAHRQKEFSSAVVSLSENNSWSGNPPLWVDKFKVSSCLILKVLAEMYCNSGLRGNLSLVLQQVYSDFRDPLEADSDSQDIAISGLCEILKQYIKLKIELDLEEIYICFRLLKRLAMKSKLFLEVYNIVGPYLQASAGEIYCGNLYI